MGAGWEGALPTERQVTWWHYSSNTQVQHLNVSLSEFDGIISIKAAAWMKSWLVTWFRSLLGSVPLGMGGTAPSLHWGG